MNTMMIEINKEEFVEYIETQKNSLYTYESLISLLNKDSLIEILESVKEINVRYHLIANKNFDLELLRKFLGKFKKKETILFDYIDQNIDNNNYNEFMMIVKDYNIQDEDFFPRLLHRMYEKNSVTKNARVDFTEVTFNNFKDLFGTKTLMENYYVIPWEFKFNYEDSKVFYKMHQEDKDKPYIKFLNENFTNKLFNEFMNQKCYLEKIDFIIAYVRFYEKNVDENKLYILMEKVKELYFENYKEKYLDFLCNLSYEFYEKYKKQMNLTSSESRNVKEYIIAGGKITYDSLKNLNYTFSRNSFNNWCYYRNAHDNALSLNYISKQQHESLKDKLENILK